MSTTAAKKTDSNVPLPLPPPPGGKAIEGLKGSRVSMPGFGWNTFEATVPANTPLHHLVASEFWRFNAMKFKRGDHIKWRDDTLTRFGELAVVASDVATGKLELRSLWTHEVAPSSVGETERCGFTPKDLGVHDGWGIVRDADDKLMAQGIASRDEAMRRIRTEFVPAMATYSMQEMKSAALSAGK